VSAIRAWRQALSNATADASPRASSSPPLSPPCCWGPSSQPTCPRRTASASSAAGTTVSAGLTLTHLVARGGLWAPEPLPPLPLPATALWDGWSAMKFRPSTSALVRMSTAVDQLGLVCIPISDSIFSQCLILRQCLPPCLCILPPGWNATNSSAPAIDFSRVLALSKQYANDTAAVRAEGFVSPRTPPGGPWGRWWGPRRGRGRAPRSPSSSSSRCCSRAPP